MSKKSHFLLEFDKQQHQIVSFSYSTTDKFENDKVLVDTEELLFILDGVVLNKKELLSSASTSDWQEFLLDEYTKNKETFFTKMKGSYWGIAVDKTSGEIVAYADHVGSKQLFHASNETTLVISSNCYDMTEYLRNHASLKPTLNEQAAYFVLNYGYTIEDMTIVEEVHRLVPGYYFTYSKESEGVKLFYRLKKEPTEISDDEAIEGIDSRFRKAIRDIFEKDKEYGYRHLVALSGGLDTRMVCCVAHDMGYTDQLNITFSQTDYLDETIAKEIASDLKHEWIFKSLDNGVFLKNVDRATQLTGGNINYFGVAHGTSLLDHLDFTSFGLLHSGLCGNSNVGTFGGEKYLNDPITLNAVTNCPKCQEYDLKIDYQDQEIYKHYNRCMIAGNNGALPTQTKSESLSPFVDLDFWEFCLSIPTEQRERHRLYKKWINKKYPKAASYVWESTKVPVNAKGNIKFKGANYSRKEFWNLAMQKTVHKTSLSKKQGLTTKNHMNPLPYWFSTNKELSAFYQDYIKENMKGLDSIPSLKKYVENMANSGDPMDYPKVLTLLSAAKMITG
ncbi:MAG: hypothetical protein P8P74_11590 [Crocinitomicaceae bacterium]|nr:hypothetical protein [Crocinitomicaceae bacterium]